MENLILANKIKKTIVVLFSLVVLAFLIFCLISFVNKKDLKTAEYTISGVPYVGIYNHKNEHKNISFDIISSIASISGYWDPQGDTMQNAIDSFRFSGNLVTAEAIVDFFAQNNYSAKEAKLTLPELKNYINPKVKTPLIAFLPISPDQPAESTYHPARILIGIDETDQKLIFHDYWLGNNYEITYTEFEKLQEKLRPDERNSYIIAQPQNLEEKLKEIDSRKVEPYPERTMVMKNAEEMFKNYAIGLSAQILGMFDEAIEDYLKITTDSNFENFFPPFFKVSLYLRMAESYYDKKDFDNALIYAQKSAGLNYGLDQPLGDWPGYEIGFNSTSALGEYSGVYRLLGDIYIKRGDLDKARENYEKALEIYPENNLAKDGILILTESK